MFGYFQPYLDIIQGPSPRKKDKMEIVYFTIKSTECTQEQLSLLYDVVKENVAACALMGQHQASAYCSTPAPAPLLLPPECKLSLNVQLVRFRCKFEE